jgi:hypothetical protein
MTKNKYTTVLVTMPDKMFFQAIHALDFAKEIEYLKSQGATSIVIAK